MPQSKQHHYYLPEFYLEFFAPMACSGLRSGAERIQATDLLAKIEGALIRPDIGLGEVGGIPARRSQVLGRLIGWPADEIAGARPADPEKRHQ